MDVDAYVAAHRGEWDRLEVLVGRRRRLTGAEAEELVDLYQRVGTHLSVIRSSSPDPALVGRLSTLVARARSAVTGTRSAGWRELGAFFAEGFPAAVYRARWWWIGAALGFLAVAISVGWWVAVNPDVQAAVATPDEISQLVNQDFADYYSSAPAASFAGRVWTNNAWVAAFALIGGGLLGLPTLWLLWQNAVNIALVGGLMASVGRLDLFFGLITPHGLLELTCVFIAAGVGLRFGWTVIDPGPLPRGRAVAAAGRTAAGVALGLAVALLVSGVIEAFVTPSGLPTWARIGIGLAAWSAFLAYVFVLGGRAARRGVTGDVTGADVADLAPVAG